MQKWKIFSDGACSGNPGPGGWGAILVSSDGWVRELGGRVDLTTNNRMELTAVIRAIQNIHLVGSTIEIFSDSTYVIQGSTQWVRNWEKRGWLTVAGTAVANVDLWQPLTALLSQHKVCWHYVRGHAGIPGNDRADAIAVHFSRGYHMDRIALYDGVRTGYPVNVEAVPSDTTVPAMRRAVTSKR